MASASARRGRGCVNGGVHLHVAVAVKVDEDDNADDKTELAD
jgi:hypothetical protein